MAADLEGVSLRDYLEARIDAVEKAAIARADAQDKAVTAALAAQQAAVQKTEVASEKRFESVNEFRSSLNDQGRLMMPRSESEKMHEAALDRHNIAHAAVVSRLDYLAARMAAYDEQRAGKTTGWSAVVSVIALIASVVGVLAFLTK